MKWQTHNAFSLLEVVVAIAMLAVALGAFAQLTSVGRRHLEKAGDITAAAQLCQSKMSEMLAGIETIETTEAAPLLNDPNWDYKVEILPTNRFDLWSLRVSVRKRDPSVATNASESAHPQGRWYTLTRWVPNRLVDPRQPNALPTDSGLPAPPQQFGGAPR